MKRNSIAGIVLCLICVCCAAAALCSCGTKKKNDDLSKGEHLVSTATPEPTAEPMKNPTKEPTATLSPEPTTEPTKKPAATLTPEPTAEPTKEPTKEPTATATPEPTAEPTKEPTTEPTKEPTKEPSNTPPQATPTNTPPQATPTNMPSPAAATATPTPTPDNRQTGNGKLIVIDAGHQRKGNSDKEPDGPGSSTMKAKCSSGTTGHFTGLPEYELNLIVSKKLQAILLERGYRVIMVRDTHDVNLSNSERAEIANKAGADVFIRVHANASDNSDVSGAETLCQTKKNPYNADQYEKSRKLSDCVLDTLCAECGCKKRHVVETDTMSGINWCKVPVTIVEMGFMTNEKEDRLMATEEYQDKLAKGIADGIDAYFADTQ